LSLRDISAIDGRLALCRHAHGLQTICKILQKDDGEFDGWFGEKMVKLLVRDKESIQEAVRRFRKLVERSGIKKEMRRREYYEKPSETNRRARLRAERRSKRNRMLAKR
jgi:small subunit ribosomal protein S21